MRTLILSLLVCILVASISIDAHAVVVSRVVSETNGELQLAFVNTGPTQAPVARFFVAIPEQGNYSVRLSTGGVLRWAEPPLFDGGVPADSVRARMTAQDDTVRVSDPVPFRGVRLLYIEFDIFKFPGAGGVLQLIDPGVTITYDPAPGTRTRAQIDPLIRDMVLNGDVFPSTSRSGAPDPWFSLSSSWVKIPVTTRGMFTITGDDLTGLGVNLTSINNPGTIRMFSTFGYEQPRSFSEPGSWMPQQAMEELAILVEDGGDGTFDVSDRIVFYGVGANGWEDIFDPSAPDSVYRKRPRTATNYYYLTWDGQMPGTPARVGQTAGAPGGGGDVTTYIERFWAESDFISNFDYEGDGWLWHDIQRTGNKAVSLGDVIFTNVVTTLPQTFRTLGLSPYHAPDLIKDPPDPLNLNDHWTRYKIRRGGPPDIIIGESQWTTASGERYYEDGIPIRHEGTFLANGANTFIFEIPTTGNPNTDDFGYFAWYSIHYHRLLRAAANTRGFPAPDSTGTVTFAVDNFTSSSAPYVFDVTDMRAPVRITGATASAGTIRFSADLAGDRRHFWAASRAGLRTPSGMQLMNMPVDLRADATGPHMLIIANDAFLGPAQRLRSHRLTTMPHYSNPRVKVVPTSEIYDNFSGGMPDALGIRNYIKFLYDNYNDGNGNPVLTYVLFLGDANEDLRDAPTSQPDLVPSHLYFTRPFTFVTDEWFGHLDANDENEGFAALDVAIGRLPAATLDEATLLVDKVIAYEADKTFGEWRKRTILVADDELQTISSACDVQFTHESERITNEFMSEFLEARKVYLTEYDRISTVKPAARAAFLEEWNRGALLINYIGHGSNRQMADEQVFVDADVTQLNNGSRLPVLLALSCTIGDFANYRVKSLSEKLLLRDTGGVISTVTASRETFANLNNRLNFALFTKMATRYPSGPQRSLGEAMMEAKVTSLFGAFNAPNQAHNNWKYNLLGDPAMRLGAPEREIRFDMGAVDSLVAGLRKTVRGAVYRDGSVDASFNGSVAVHVREPDINRVYRTQCAAGSFLLYRVAGGVLYDGTADVTNGRFSFSFRVPRSAERGPLSFLSAYADDGITDASETLDSTLVLVSPTIADSTGLRALDGAPRVTMGFKSGLTTVKPGETLQALVRDADGINILDTTNEGKQAIIFDDLPVPLDANEFFNFDHGGTDTSGVLLFPLPELEFGEHRAIYKVSDAFGQTTLDTMVFSVTDPRAFTAEVLLNYPNPFTDDTSFLIRLSDRADIRLDIFTLSGRRIRRLEAQRDGGEVWIRWDGRDAHGAEIANGVYLYVATVDFTGLERPPLTLRGKLVRIE